MSWLPCSILLASVVIAAGCRSVKPTTVPVPTRVDSGAFVVTLGNDTLSAESFRRTDNRIEGVIVRRIPRVTVLRYIVTVASSGLARQLEYYVRSATGDMLPGGARNVSVVFTPDSVFTEIRRDTLVARRVAAANAYPELDGSMSLYGLPIAALETSKRDSARFISYVPGAPRGISALVTRRGAGKYWVYVEGDPLEISTDSGGNVIAVDGSRTTLRIQSRRQPTVDTKSMAASFAERERAAGPISALSPRDSSTWIIGGARISVGYGRPAARGRRIFGPNGVLGDTLWRTGANQETKLYTNADLVFGDRRLAAGTYSLMTLAVPDRYQLIISQGTQQLRVPLQAAELSPPLERFTIVVEPSGERAGTIRLRWDTMELSAPFTVVPPVPAP
jgi:hypothetical protein